MFESIAWAMAPPAGQGQAPGGADLIISIVPFVVIILIFYFLIIVPQKKKAKEHRDMLESLKKGDKVVTTGGAYGLVESVGDRTVVLKIAENVKVKYGKGYIAEKRGSSEDD